MTFHNTNQITKEEKELFKAIRDSDYDNIALLSVTYKNKPNVCICAINRQGNDYSIQPLFLKVDQEIIKDLKDSFGKIPYNM